MHKDRREILKAGVVLGGGLLLPGLRVINALAQVPSVDGVGFPDIGSIGRIDDYTGGLKGGSRLKGPFCAFFGGLFTDEGEFFVDNDPFDTNFPVMRQALMQVGSWDMDHFLPFKYGKKGLDRYTSLDTLVEPEVTFKNVDEAMEGWIASYDDPYFHLFGSSYGGVLALRAAMKYTENILSLNLFSSPAKGIVDNYWNRGKLWTGKRLIATLSGFPLSDEYVSGYLFDRSPDQGLLDEIDRFGESFTASGKPLNIAASTDDPLFEIERTRISGARYFDISYGKVYNPADFLVAHTRTMNDPQITRSMALSVGSMPKN